MTSNPNLGDRAKDPNINPNINEVNILDQELHQPLSLSRSLFSYGMTAIAFVLTILALVPLLSLLFEIVRQGHKRLSWDVFIHTPAPVGTGDPSGFINAIVGTLIMVAIAAMISIPIGGLTGVFLAEFGKGSKFGESIRFVTVVLSSVPSIIAGVFAYAIVVRHPFTILGITIGGFSALAGGVALSVIMLPIVALTTEESLKLVPESYRLASAALGGARFHTIFRIVIPAALPAITTGALLAVARAAGETAPLIFTALSSQFWPDWSDPAHWFNNNPTPSLSVLIYEFSTSSFKEENEMAWTAAIILVGLVLVASMLSRFFTRKRVSNN